MKVKDVIIKHINLKGFDRGYISYLEWKFLARFFQTDSVSEPDKGLVQELDESDEGNEVNSNVGDKWYRLGSSFGGRLDDISFLAEEKYSTHCMAYNQFYLLPRPYFFLNAVYKRMMFEGSTINFVLRIFLNTCIKI